MGAEQSIPRAESSPKEDSESAAKTPQKLSTPSALVVSGPSGVGKGTLIQILLEESDQFAFSVSHTTRPSRSGEKVPNTVFRDFAFLFVFRMECIIISSRKRRLKKE